MAGIGDYIHLKNSNYLRYGTTFRGPSDLDSASALFAAQRQKMLNTINSSTKTQIAGLEEFLNGLLYGNEGNMPGYLNEAWQQFDRVVSEIFHEKYGQFDFNYSQGLNVYANLKFLKQNRKIIKYNELKKYLDRIANMVNGNISVKKEAPIEELKNIQQQLDIYLQTHSEDSQIRLDTRDGQNILRNINYAMAFQSMPHNLAIGDIAEIFFAAASIQASQKSEKVSDELLKDMIKGIVVGGQGSKPTISMNNFDEKKVDLRSILSSGWQQIDENNSFELSTSSQDKVDVNFQWNGNTLGVSAKNYSLASSEQTIHILSGSNLLYLISNEDSTMINHWLNLISTSDRDEGDVGGLLQQAHEVIKISILIKAITGQGLGRKGVADTFFLNARSRRHIYVFTAEQLAQNALKHLNNIEFGGYPDSGFSHYYEGTYPSEEEARIRITNLLKNVSNCKISVALPQATFF